ncbi:non-canonical purine NTP pyrophosphatase [Pyrodictium occultum]|uniref:dITP/XTP pyrophosphatase n=1 Tax=Pyrodictium occultum TaxID=2309 RepID=A0A0V8RTD2_PYROC|nr:XTP/dITP diphosphatase [Pyrodictium occultum]KSW11323.1 non-canonical purine NTP pyrophosphatase [Pyrodictium occultum]
MAPGRVIYAATSNMHKIRELERVLSECGYRVEPIAAPKVELQGDLRSVALYAASLAYSIVGRPLIVEDAGLFIEALNGFPGPYSAYVYKTIGIEGVVKLMEGVADRRAYFYSVIALAYDRGVALFEGRCDGRIAEEPRGTRGFGFDPIFIPEGESRTFAEMSIEEKNMYSHRARAARRLCSWLESGEELGGGR